MASTILQIIITPITELAKLLLVPLREEVGYIVRSHRNIEDLQSKIKELENNKEATQNAVTEACRRGHAATHDIQQWISKTQLVITEVNEYLNDLRERDSGKSKVLCTNVCKRCKSSRRAVKLLKIVNELRNGLQHIPVSQPAPPPNIEMMPTNDFEAYESTKATIDKIIQALIHDDNKVIGVYGMGGVGKTSLIKVVAKYVKRMKMFDEVVIATVSRNPDMRKIQKEIAEGLGLQLTEETEHLRSLRLNERIKQQPWTFIILDDVWERIELAQIGIPCGKDENTCKVAITTRNLDVCSEMGCNFSIMVEPLSDQGSWDLFKKVAGNVVDLPDVNNLANEIVRECGGLPIALVTLGRVLKNKETRFWEDAAYELRQSRPLNIKGMHEKVFPCLKLSFDEFQNEESQMCYLYCALFPEDHDVRIEDLLRYGIGERLFSDVISIDQARNRVHSIISNLKASCLLISSKNNECVKLHDVFRDLAILIATTNDYSFMVKASSGLKEWPRNLKLEYVMRMSLVSNEFSMFQGYTDYPELILLLLQNNTLLKVISDEFFAGMKALQVLDLSSMPSLEALPTSISSLTNLRTLFLENNFLKDSSALQELNSLEILSFRKSSFAKFPEEIRRLTNLRLLDLSDCQIDEIPAKVFTRLSYLEELYMGRSYSDWEIEDGKNNGKATLAEVLSLESLNILHIDITNNACLTKEIIDSQLRLKKFQVHIGERLGSLTTYSTTMCLNIQEEFRIPRPVNWLKGFLRITLELSLVSWKDPTNLNEFPSESFKSLKKLHIQQCHFQTLFSSSIFDKFQSLQEIHIFSCLRLDTVFLSTDSVPQNNIFPSLTNIHIQEAPNLKALWRGVTSTSIFQGLKYMKVELSESMDTLFPFVIAKTLLKLEYLEISDCHLMEAIVCDIETKEVQQNTLSGKADCTNIGQLSYERTKTLFPKLKTLKLKHLKNIRSLTQPIGFLLDFPALEQLTVVSCPWLKLPLGLQRLIEIKAERKWFEELEFEDNQVKLSLQKCFTDVNTLTHEE